jgi:hypothetical protein
MFITVLLAVKRKRKRVRFQTGCILILGPIMKEE